MNWSPIVGSSASISRTTCRGSWILGGITLCVPFASAQQYSEERIPVLNSPSTASNATVTHGDFDGDGRQDLVVREFGNVDLVVRRGTIEFTPVDIVFASDSLRPGIADLNGDGRADLLTQSTSLLGYFPGQVGATLGAFVGIEQQSGNDFYWTKRAGDVDGDGNLDFVVSLSTDNFGQTGELRWFAGNGSGGFGLAQSVPSTPYPLRFVLGDFDADGFLDAVAVGPTSGTALFFGSSGSGLLAPQPIALTSNGVGPMEAGDVDLDGIDDLVYAGTAPKLEWLRGGATGLSLGGSQVLAGVTGYFPDLRIGDLESDGDLDVLVAEISSGHGRLWRSFASPGSGLGNATAIPTRPTMAIDLLEFDGKPGLDLVSIELSRVWPTLQPGDGAGGFTENSDYSAPGSCVDSDSACAGDIDRDGILDVAFESGSWLRGVGDGTFQVAAPLGARPSELLDLDGDGRLDAVSMLLGCGAQSGLNVALANATGFGPTSKPSQPASGLISQFAFGDLDADGDLDLVTASNSGTYTHRNTGAGAFASFVTTALPGPCSGIAVGDLNGDGFDDLARVGFTTDPFTGSVVEATLRWGMSTGTGNVTGVQSRLLFQYATGQAHIDDLNGDGFADIAWASPGFNQVAAFHGDGAGGLSATTTQATMFGSTSVLAFAVADMDGDGVRDLIGGSGPNGHVCISRRDGSTYETWRDLDAGPDGAHKILPYDFNADGQIDLAWGSGTSLRVAVNRRDDGAGTTPFGTGTSGCLGRAALGAVQAAKLGNGAFRVLANHLPPSALGWFLISTGSSLGGFDPFAVGALLHVDPLPPNTFTLIPMASTASGQASLGLPIPNSPALAGFSVAIQTAHYGVGSPGFDCSTSPFSLVTSRGLALTIQP